MLINAIYLSITNNISRKLDLIQFVSYPFDFRSRLDQTWINLGLGVIVDCRSHNFAPNNLAFPNLDFFSGEEVGIQN